MKVKEYLKNLEDNDSTLYTTDGKHFMFKDEFLKEYPDDLEIKEIKEDSEGKIVYTQIKRKFTNDCDFEVTLTQWADGSWFIDMGCQLWNRIYKSEKVALNYLAKHGWKEV